MASSSESLGVRSSHSSTTISSRSNNTRDGGTLCKAGRQYLDHVGDGGDLHPYPLPIDLAETHRQHLLTQLGLMVFGAPFLSADLLAHPPRRVLDLGCDTGFWSRLCHQYFSQRGHSRISFVGVDIQKPQPDVIECHRAMGMDWEYVQHDLGETPWPFDDGSFDVIMAKDLALALRGRQYSNIVNEYSRVLKPGGTFEIWEHDYILRSLTPKVQDVQQQQRGDSAVHAQLRRMGVYSADNSSLLRPAANAYANEYNNWIRAGLAARELPSVPCSFITGMLGAGLVAGAEKFTGTMSRHIAVPLAPVHWELEPDGDGRRQQQPRVLTEEQKAVRQTALEVFVGMVDAFELVLRAASGKDQASWDAWLSKAKKNWMQNDGFALGEFLEIAAWSMTNKTKGDGED